MADNVNFDRLVSGLSLDERQNLLGKLKEQSSMSSEPLYTEDEKTIPGLDIETEYPKLPWFYRLGFFILSLFKARPSVKIYEDHQILVLGAKTDEKSPGLYDYQRAMLMPAFYRQMVKLKEAARFFYSALDMSVNRDKGAFFSFLGSLEMADIHRKLQEVTDPTLILEKYPDLSETELRQMAFKAMDEVLSTISDSDRSLMYFDARSLYCLKELSSFLFDRVIMAFSSGASGDGETCSANLIREYLISLNNILRSLLVVPPLPLLESLFVFILQERAAEPGFDFDREIRGLLIKAEESLDVIREFNKQVPLTWIIRCATRNMSFSSKPISGGEDWFVVYRDYWKRRVESLFGDYMKDRRYRDLLNQFRYLLKGTSLRMLENTQSETNPDGLPIRGAFALSFLYTFYLAVFMSDINRILRPILIDGEFQKKENRVEFAESYNTLIKLEDEIYKFDHDISPEGDYGKRYAKARQEMASLPVKRRKIQIVIDEASKKAGMIIVDARDASRSMVNLLNGITAKDSRGKLDVLSNLEKMAKKDSRFMSGLSEIIQQFQTVLKLLDDIETMETRR